MALFYCSKPLQCDRYCAWAGMHNTRTLKVKPSLIRSVLFLLWYVRISSTKKTLDDYRIYYHQIWWRCFSKATVTQGISVILVDYTSSRDCVGMCRLKLINTFITLMLAVLGATNYTFIILNKWTWRLVMSFHPHLNSTYFQPFTPMWVWRAFNFNIDCLPQMKTLEM